MKAMVLLVLVLNSIAWADQCKQTAVEPVYVTGQEKNFCLNFIPGYLQMMKTPHTVTFRGKSYDLAFNNKKMMMFMLAQVSIESGWASSMAVRNNNYWGLGGNYPKPDGSNTFMNFKSFDEGHAYLFNHMAYGLTATGADHRYHPGWPKFLNLVKSDREDISDDEINRSLNSGPYCNKFPAYNTDRLRSCAHLGPKKCACINYSGVIFGIATKRLLSKCIATYEEYYNQQGQAPLRNYVTPDVPQAQNEALVAEAYRFLTEYESQLKSNSSQSSP